MKVENLINDNGNRAVNQFVIFHDNCIYFQSYETMIAKYDRSNGVLYITRDWDCSNTTRKHFYIWLKEYTYYNVSRENVMRCIKDGIFKVVDENEITL